MKNQGELELLVFPEPGRQLNSNLRRKLRSGQRNLKKPDLRLSNFFEVMPEVLVRVHPGDELLVRGIEIGLEHTPFAVSVYFFPHLNMQKAVDYGPQQH